MKLTSDRLHRDFDARYIVSHDIEWIDESGVSADAQDAQKDDRLNGHGYHHKNVRL